MIRTVSDVVRLLLLLPICVFFKFQSPAGVVTHKAYGVSNIYQVTLWFVLDPPSTNGLLLVVREFLRPTNQQFKWNSTSSEVRLI